MQEYRDRIIQKAQGLSKQPEFWLRFAAYAIPLAFLLYVLYWNFLPFGYSKTFVINVGAEGDTNSSQEFYLEPSQDLSERKVAEDGTTYRELNGVAYAVFKPKTVLKDAEIAIDVRGEGVSIIPPVIDFDPSSINWEYSWDFTKDKPPAQLGLIGNAFAFDGCMYFNGRNRLELPDSADKFEEDPFSVYVEWTPEDDAKDFQQIIGHYNWEFLQNSDSVSFQAGRMNNAQGPIYSIRYPVEENFFYQRHSALAIYNPSDNGYIDLFVDGNLAGRSYFATSTIWNNYNGSKELSFGKSEHGSAQYYTGSLCNSRIINKNILNNGKNINFKISSGLEDLIISLGTEAQAFLHQIKLSVTQQ